MRIERTGGSPPQEPSPTTHVASEGETLQSIANDYGISKDALAKANTMPADGTIRVGQELIIPSAAENVSGEPIRFGIGDVKDSFESGVAAKAFAEGVAAKFLEGAAAKAFAEGAAAKAFAEGAVAKAFVEGAAAKAFAEGAVAKAFVEGAAAKAFAEGAVAKAFVEGAAAKAFVEGNFQMYSVKQGDTIGTLANRFGISAEELARANNVETNTRLNAGAELKIPVK